MITPETAKMILEALRVLVHGVTAAFPSLANVPDIQIARAAIKQAEEELND